MYNPDKVGSFAMMFGQSMCSSNVVGKYTYAEKKKYRYIDKRTKKYGAQRVELLKNNKKF